MLVPVGDAGGVYLILIGKLELQVGGYLVVTVTGVGKLHIEEVEGLLEVGASIARHVGNLGADGDIDIAQDNALRGGIFDHLEL